MRKDVKIGVGIGGVLLAVLIVYLLVPKNETTSQFTQTDSADTNGGGPDATRIGGSQTADATRAPAGTSAAEGETGDVSRGGATAEAAEAGTATRAERDAASGVDWTKILETGIVESTPLMATTPAPERDDPFGEPHRTTPAATGGASDQIDWSRSHATPPAGTSGTTGVSGKTTPITPARVTRTGLGEHVVQQNETLSSISLAAYGDSKYYKEILKANPTLDERKMRPGMTVKLPDPSTFKTAQPAAARQVAAPAPVDPKTEYRVGPGDNLHKIAVKLYGKAGKADELYELNKAKIGEDSARLKLGMVLKLPEAPSNTASSSR
jgi:nucleoid-associated protein YgaU